MAQLGGTFDATQVAPREPMEILPPGDYRAQIIQSEMRATKDGTGQFLWLEMDVIDGPMQGRKIWDRLNLVNRNAQAMDIAQRTLSAICHAVGVLAISDSEQLHFKPMVVAVKTVPRQDNPSELSNEVKGYKSVNGNAAPPAPAPAYGTPPGPAPHRPPAAAAPAPAAAAPPWKRSA
jgi:hypothetical protein